MKPPARKSRLRAGVRLVLGLAVLAVLVARSGTGELRHVFRTASLSPVLLAWIAMGAGLVLSAIRWSVFLRALGLDRPIGYLARLYAAGVFFNAFLPTGIGGDVYKALRVRGDAASTGASFASVILDRVSGLIALALMGTIAGGMQLASARTTAATTAAVVFSGLVLAGTLAWAASRGTIERRFLRREPRRLRSIVQVLRALDTGTRDPRSTGWGLLWAVAFQASVVGFHALLLHSLRLSIQPGGIVCVVVLVTLASFVPLTINGLGIREAAYVWSLRQYGVDAHNALALGLLVLGLLLATSVVGGIIYSFGWAGPHLGARRENGAI